MQKFIPYIFLLLSVVMPNRILANDTAYIQPVTGDKLLDTIEVLNNYAIDSVLANPTPFFAIVPEEDIYFQWLIQNIDLQLNESDTVVVADTSIISAIRNCPDSLFKHRLQALPRQIDMTYNHVVRAFILRYLASYPKLTVKLDALSQYYFPIFEDMLSKYGLPDELKYLAVIESALNPMAHSRMGAAGLWQFMPSTGRLFNLEINSLIDERRDPIKSTEAACRYLVRLYHLFDDWTLALAAYNCGPGNVLKAMRRSGKKDFWGIYSFLPRETRSYVPIFVAANYALTYYKDHRISPIYVNITFATDTIVTDKRQHFEQISSLLGVSVAELRRLNPQYTKDIIPGYKDYALCLPANRVLTYIDLQDSILAYRQNELINNRKVEIDLAQRTAVNRGGTYSVNGVTYYKIRRGDTLSGIAQRFHCSVSQLQKWNGLKGSNISAGKTLKIMR